MEGEGQRRSIGTCLWALLVACLVIAPAVAQAADPQRGMSLFMTPPVRGELACADCHSDNPQVNNFGNIWVGRNTVALIQRAVSSNTGGMGYFASYYTPADLADIAAWLGNSPSALSFPPTVPGNTSAAQHISISSSTKVDLTGLVLALEGEFVVIANNCGTVVPRLSSCAVDLAFRPRADGSDAARSGTLHLRHDGAPTPVRLPLLGQVQLKPPAVANVAPAALDFGSAVVGLASAQRHARLSNGSSSELVLGPITLSSPAFTISGGSCHEGLALGAGRSCLLSLRMVAPASGAQRGELRVQHDGVGGQSVVALAGTATTGPVADLRADVMALDFGVGAAGARTGGPLVTLANVGNRAALLREAVTTDPAFSIERSSCTAGMNLLPGQRCQIALAWTAAREGAVSAELRLAAEGAIDTLRLPLAGLTATTVLQATPSRLAFDAALGQASERSLRLVNRGSLALRLGTLALSGPEAADFALGPGGDCTSGLSLAPGSACVLPLRFTPRAAGSRLARLQASVDGQAAPLLVELFGDGTPGAQPSWMLDAAVLHFADRSLGDTGVGESQTLTLRSGSGLAAPQLRLIGDAAGDYTLVNGCMSALPAQGSCTITLRFVPTAAGSRSASLWLGAAGGLTLGLVTLQARALAATPVLVAAPAATPGNLTWVSTPTFASAAVGDSASSATLELLNRGSTASMALAWAIGGERGADFSIDPASPCVGAVLAPGARCTLRVNFHPGGSGERRAWLRAASEPSLPGLELRGRGLARVRGELRVSPASVVFQARTGVPSEPQRLSVHNDGAAEVDVAAIELRGSAFVPADSGSLACAAALLAPGEACTLELSWPGSAAAVAGSTLALSATDAFASAQLPIVVSEDPAQRSNAGTGGGALIGASWAWLAALLLACRLLQRTARRQS